MSIKDYFLDMDIDAMCDELGITQEDILERFDDKLHEYYAKVDRGYQRDLIQGYVGEYYDAEDIEWEEYQNFIKSRVEQEQDE